VPAIKTAVQRPDAIMREKGGVDCSVVLILVAGVWRNGRKEKKEEEEEKKEEAMLRKFVQFFFLNCCPRRLEGVNHGSGSAKR
jgi:hypothetical protein